MRSLPLRRSEMSIVLLAAAFCFGGCEALGLSSPPAPPVAPSEVPIAVTETYWTEPNEHTPAASDGPLAFALTLGVREGQSTLVATGRYSLPGAIRQRYGDDPRHQIMLVAINTDAQRIHAAPVGPEVEAEGDVFADGGGESLTGTFNVDVPVALGLPVLSAPYQFFLWIDEHVTERQSFVTPGNEIAREGREVLPVTGPALLLEEVEGEGPVPSVSASTEEGTSQVRGLVARDRHTHSMIPFLIMSVERPSNAYGYARVVMPLAESPYYRFDLDARHLFFEHEPEGRVWTIGMLAEASSEPVSFRVPEPEELADGGVAAPAEAPTEGTAESSDGEASGAPEEPSE